MDTLDLSNVRCGSAGLSTALRCVQEAGSWSPETHPRDDLKLQAQPGPAADSSPAQTGDPSSKPPNTPDQPHLRSGSHSPVWGWGGVTAGVDTAAWRMAGPNPPRPPAQLPPRLLP